MNREEFEHDRDFQLLHKQYQRQSEELPPVSVDESILQAAHQVLKESVSPTSQNNVKTSDPGWYVPASVVAVLVLSLSVVMKLAFEPVAEYEPAESAVMVDNDLKKASRMKAAKIEADSADAIKMEIDQSYLKYRMKITQEKKTVAKAKRSKLVVHQMQAGATPDLAGSVQHNESKENSSVAVTVVSVPESVKLIGVKPPQASEEAADRVFNDLVANISSQQKKQLDRLMVLLEKSQFEELKLAMKAYRKKYPLNEHDFLPKQLRALEIKWQIENTSKSLQVE